MRSPVVLWSWPEAPGCPRGPLKFKRCISEIQIEGSVSQNLDISLSFDFIKCRISDRTGFWA